MVCSICRQRGHNRRTCPHNNVTLRTPTQRSIMQNINDDMINILPTDDLIVQALNNEDMINMNGFDWGDELVVFGGYEDDNDSMPELIEVQNEEEKETEENNTVYESETCCICLENIKKTNTCTTKCGHQFCLTCLFDNINSTNDGKLDCPMCRKNVYQMDMKHSQIQRYKNMTDLANEAVQREFMRANINISSVIIEMFDRENTQNTIRNILSDIRVRQSFEYRLKILIGEITSANNNRVNDIISDSSFSNIFDVL